jgi:hypothetical protein
MGLANPAAGVATYLASAALNVLEKPDVYGDVQLLINGRVAGRRQLVKGQDSFTPQWAAGWRGVSWDKNPTLVVALMDADLQNDDPIGSVTVTNSELERALTTGKTIYVPVGDQANGQVLFLLVAVTAEGWRFGSQTTPAR